MAPEHQPREHPVPCRVCYLATRRRTWNLDALCDDCRARRAHPHNRAQSTGQAIDNNERKVS